MVLGESACVICILKLTRAVNAGESVEKSYLGLDAARVVQLDALAVELPAELNGQVAARGGALDGERLALHFVGWEQEVLLQRGRLCARIRTE